MCAKKMKAALLTTVFRRIKTGGAYFYPEAREAIKEAYEYIKSENIRAAVKAVRRTELSYSIYREAKQSASKIKTGE